MCVFFNQRTASAHSVLFLEGEKETGIHFSWSYLICTFGFQGFSVACENPEYISATESSAWISQQCQNVYLFIYESLLTGAPQQHPSVALQHMLLSECMQIYKASVHCFINVCFSYPRLYNLFYLSWHPCLMKTNIWQNAPPLTNFSLL